VLLDDVEDLRAARVHRPAVDVGTAQAVPAQQFVDEAPDVHREHLRHLRRQPHPEAEVGDVPGHVVGGGGVRDGGHLAYGVPPGGRRAEHDGGRGVREERVRHHLLDVRPAAGRLQVQAGQLHAEQQRRTAAGHREVRDRAQPRQRRVTAHVADEEPLHVR
jgi:hypothetical protein